MAIPSYRILYEGYRISGGRETPLRAVVPYIVAWSDAFAFYNTVLGQTSAATQSVASIVRTSGLAFPASPALYAESAEIEPYGVGNPSGSTNGLSPGEYFAEAKITVTFSTPTYDQDEANPARQLDPDNPITYCEQEVDSSVRYDTEKASGWEFEDGTNIPGPFVKPTTESKLVLTFPRVPFLPWKAVRPFTDKLNSIKIFDYEIGTLKLDGTKIKATNTNQGLASTSTQLVFSGQDYDWNMLRKKDGTLALVRNKADTSKRMFAYADFRQIFL
jgi:hypothetical protein